MLTIQIGSLFHCVISRKITGNDIELIIRYAVHTLFIRFQTNNYINHIMTDKQYYRAY